jgi:hypothetical protein
MARPAIVLAVVSVLQLIAVIAAVVSASAGVVGVAIALWRIRRDYRQARDSDSVGGSPALRRSTLVFLCVGLALIAVGGLIYKVTHPPAITGRAFPVMPNYHPSGLMGDIGDLRPPARMEEGDRFTYEPLGRPPHEYDYKYVNGTLNEKPAQFAGVMYLHPRGNWGTDPTGGYDLRRVADVIRWEARSVEGDVYVEFLIGGITWMWDEPARRQVSAPYPDSLPATSLGTKKLTPAWTVFEVDLHERGRVKDDFKRVVGGFGWVITWAANGLDMPDSDLSSNKTRIFTIEICNIRYERKQK